MTLLMRPGFRWTSNCAIGGRRPPAGSPWPTLCEAAVLRVELVPRSDDLLPVLLVIGFLLDLPCHVSCQQHLDRARQVAGDLLGNAHQVLVDGNVDAPPGCLDVVACSGSLHVVNTIPPMDGVCMIVRTGRNDKRAP